MGAYNKTIITNSGYQAIAEAIASGQALAFTTAKTSSYQIPSGTNIAALTALQDIQQSIELPTPTVYNDTVVQVYARFSNTNVTTEYPINAIGVYASVAGGDEVLFAVSTAITPDIQPVFDENAPSAFIFNIQMIISNAASITFAVNDSGTATVSDINRIDREMALKVSSTGGNISGTVAQTLVESAEDFPIPAAGETMGEIIGKVKKFNADASAPFTGATNTVPGKKGLVPAPDVGQNASFLRGDGRWIPAAQMKDIWQVVYPVGAIYMSVNSVSPATLFGGTWSRISDRFLLAAGSSYSAGSTGGEASHALTTAEMPGHTHTIGAHSHGLNAHTHSIGAHSHGLNSHKHSIPALSGTAASNGAHTHNVIPRNTDGICFTEGGKITQGGDTTVPITWGGGLYAASAGAHTHSVTTNASTTGAASGNTANSTPFNSGAASGSTANSAVFNSGSTGSGTAHNNMPPYLAVYMWQRTA